MHTKRYFEEVNDKAKSIDIVAIEKLTSELLALSTHGGAIVLVSSGQQRGKL